jgi:hypothetical protein
MESNEGAVALAFYTIRTPQTEAQEETPQLGNLQLARTRPGLAFAS